MPAQTVERLLAFDIDSDGREEVVVLARNAITVLRGEAGVLTRDAILSVDEPAVTRWAQGDTPQNGPILGDRHPLGVVLIP